MSSVRRPRVYSFIVCGVLLFAASVSGQSPASNEDLAAQPDHPQMNMGNGWQVMQDGVLFGMFNHQGGSRGADEFKAPNCGWAWRLVKSDRRN